MNPQIMRAKFLVGQAMVEFLVAALFCLVPLFLAICAIGKLTDVQHTTDMAARYAAWERTVWYEDGGTGNSLLFKTYNNPNQKSTNEIRNEIAVRILNDRSSTISIIKNTDRTASTFANGLDPMWHDPSGDTYLSDYAQLTLSATNEIPKKDLAVGALGLLTKALAILPKNMSGTILPPVPLDTLIVEHVSLNKVAKTSGTYKRLWPDLPWIGLDFVSTSAILSNTWSANSAVGTKSMVAESVPSAQGLFNTYLNGIKTGLLIWDPIAAGKIDVGKIAVDEVPPDRLK